MKDSKAARCECRLLEKTLSLNARFGRCAPSSMQELAMHSESRFAWKCTSHDVGVGRLAVAIDGAHPVSEPLTLLEAGIAVLGCRGWQLRDSAPTCSRALAFLNAALHYDPGWTTTMDLPVQSRSVARDDKIQRTGGFRQDQPIEIALVGDCQDAVLDRQSFQSVGRACFPRDLSDLSRDNIDQNGMRDPRVFQ